MKPIFDFSTPPTSYTRLYVSGLSWYGRIGWGSRRNIGQHWKPGLLLFFFFICSLPKHCRSVFLLCFRVNRKLVQVSNAVDHVQSGTTALQTAKKLQRNSRKWMCIAIVILLVIVGIIVVGVIQPWKSGKGAWVCGLEMVFKLVVKALWLRAFANVCMCMLYSLVCLFFTSFPFLFSFWCKVRLTNMVISLGWGVGPSNRVLNWQQVFASKGFVLIDILVYKLKWECWDTCG